MYLTVLIVKIYVHNQTSVLCAISMCQMSCCVAKVEDSSASIYVFIYRQTVSCIEIETTKSGEH